MLTIKLDEAVRLVDELPLLSQPEAARAQRRRAARGAPRRAGRGVGGGHRRRRRLARRAGGALGSAARGWSEEAKSLVRVTRIDQPEAMLVAPEQAFFLRENLKLRLLNARLALLSRQFDTAQADLREVQPTLDRYFDRSSRRVAAVSELVRQVSAQARGSSCRGPTRRWPRWLQRSRASERHDTGASDARRHLAGAAVRCRGRGRARRWASNDGLVSFF